MANSNENTQARNLLKEALMLIPNFLKLLYRLLKDARVPLTEKALLIGTITYVVSPLDFIPDVIPFVGQVDDVYLIALVILRLLSRTDDAILNEHWDGRGDLVRVVDRIEQAARYVLPERVRRILLGRVEIAPRVKGGLLSSPSAPEDLEQRRRESRR
jgi:uncharacterized membrane protein YkvA (DUF1232 family)